MIMPDKDSTNRLTAYLEQVRISIDQSNNEENLENFRIGFNSSTKNTFIATFYDVKALHHTRAFFVL
jgi:hypothetical protein